ncbi:transcriptional regulator [Halobacteriovorax marinus]|uniref:Transcriptional regulator n=1 Tax=Halobacteriovorax marinus TaxID=97084 RepID=A0A1Y5F3Y9_9BACT|nr:transcriptional regulator [Halobacteriovorax marinus]
MKKIILCSLLLINLQAANILPTVKIADKDGGRLDGSAWSTSEMKGKVHVLFYVDPDEKDLNEEASQAIKKENFPLDKYAAVAVINMKATWLPNFALDSALKEKQKEYPDTLYVKDLTKSLLKKWSLKDDSSNILLFNKKGENIYTIFGKAKSSQIKVLISLIKLNL